MEVHVFVYEALVLMWIHIMYTGTIFSGFFFQIRYINFVTVHTICICQNIGFDLNLFAERKSI